MSVGIVLHNLVLFFVCLIWFRSVQAFLGILLGLLAAVAMLISMAYSAELCADSGDENYARRKMTIHAAVRSLALFAAIALSWKLLGANLLTLFLGILGLKTGAYLYPAVHKFLNHRAGNASA